MQYRKTCLVAIISNIEITKTIISFLTSLFLV